MANWRTPPTITPTAREKTGSEKKSRSRRAARIMEMFKTTGDRAGAAKWRRELRIPMQRATREIKKI